MEAPKPWPKPTPENVAAYQRSQEREKLIQPGVTVRFICTPATNRVKPGTVGVVQEVEDSFATVIVRFLRFFRLSVYTHVSILEPVEEMR